VLKQPEGHPRRTVLALRAAIASGDALPVATAALFDAYWARGEDLESGDVVAAALTRAGLDGRELVARAASAEVKDDLRRRTSDAVSLGVFGVPSFVLPASDGHELYWGNDRIDFVARALGLSTPSPDRGPTRAEPASLEFFFDLSSPFAYLASTQVRSVAARTGARLTLRPLLLGGLFKSIGTPEVPLFQMAQQKQVYVGRDLQRWAEHWKVPFRFPSVFPIRSLAPLRAWMAAPADLQAPLLDALYRAAWGEDRDIASPSVLAEVLAAAGCDAAGVLARSQSDEVKNALKEATVLAEQRGVFGVPTFVVRQSENDAGTLLWGQDRLSEVERLCS